MDKIVLEGYIYSSNEFDDDIRNLFPEDYGVGYLLQVKTKKHIDDFCGDADFILLDNGNKIIESHSNEHVECRFFGKVQYPDGLCYTYYICCGEEGLDYLVYGKGKVEILPCK